ncbi:alpha/beta hydrolase family protein [Tuwongella immobilis]|uniref:Acetyl xylan esterase domain-containing protein n=1 Tax=Tuwongella immobilis TaxID=692036 RepID=A0A6C2YPR8_9BACT|nr:alpha/beta hydrolase family protein [Tuwongella immobilis]VIP03456.1 Uncharacterized protein OS=Blastopirellula marina DSM 3645 GN=DSM3645_20962 PE=4 SV=1: AXE1 [Tuwongella immobilis]VTS04284.1 Uncharacterized protein OS=Blastopirellula marina DSM 3645 GN=DSM3645_20962 PE=4 SV=1: AXE1 [Tuwongella immobilis]
MNARWIPVVILAGLASWAVADEPKLSDTRRGNLKTLNDYFPFSPPLTKNSWDQRREQLRTQLLVSQNLWPMPEKTPLKPVIHGDIVRDGYIVQKVYFASLPGHYVTGNLYVPTHKSGEKLPGVLCPHGHWANGRFFDAGETAAKAQIAKGAEKTMAGARYPLQARCAQLARMGCVVFHYDMVGYADSQLIPHRAGFVDAQAELRLQNFMGLQTWNTIRALDFLVSLPMVNPEKIGVTGASGGGTQTFMLGALDDRPSVAFPAVMVSTAMQGGCICENCSYLRVDTGNVEIAGMFAPKPLGMTGANDWTIDIEKKGLPELKSLYRLYGAEAKVDAKCYPEFEHNYNQVSRERMYAWMNQHLLGKSGPVAEQPFEPIPPKELSVFDAKHPVPADAKNAAQLRETLTTRDQASLAKLLPNDVASVPEFRRVIGAAFQVMVGDSTSGEALFVAEDELEGRAGERIQAGTILRKGANIDIPTMIIRGKETDGRVVIWADPRGKMGLYEGENLSPAVIALLNAKATVIAIDPLGVGGARITGKRTVDPQFAGYTFGYNRPLLSEHVRDLLATIHIAHKLPGTKSVNLIGIGRSGVAAALAKSVSRDPVDRTAVDLAGFQFEKITKTDDPMMLPGALRFGGMTSVLALCAPGELLIGNHQGGIDERLLPKMYEWSGKPASLRLDSAVISPGEMVKWMVR